MEMPEKIILDTDMLTDCDDAAALAVLLNLEAMGECCIQAICVSSKHPCSAAVVNAITTYYGRESIPIGAPKDGKGAYRSDSCFLEPVSAEFSHKLPNNDAVTDAVQIYREALAEAADHEITIVTIGYMTNLASLLESPPDGDSDLSGMELVRKKVKRWVCMGGNFPEDDAKDNVNFTRDMPSAYAAISAWPGRIDFVGREIGHNIYAGNHLRYTPKQNPVRRAYEIHRGRYSQADWNHHTADPSTILYAVRGDRDYFDLSPKGSINLNEDGTFRWVESETGRQYHVLPHMEFTRIAGVLEELICRQPASMNHGNKG